MKKTKSWSTYRTEISSAFIWAPSLPSPRSCHTSPSAGHRPVAREQGPPHGSPLSLIYFCVLIESCPPLSPLLPLVPTVPPLLPLVPAAPSAARPWCRSGCARPGQCVAAFLTGQPALPNPGFQAGRDSVGIVVFSLSIGSFCGSISAVVGGKAIYSI